MRRVEKKLLLRTAAGRGDLEVGETTAGRLRTHLAAQLDLQVVHAADRDVVCVDDLDVEELDTHADLPSGWALPSASGFVSSLLRGGALLALP